MSLRLLVTGGAGFVGREICRQALARGHRVASFDQGKTPLAEVQSISGDIRDFNAVREAAKSADVVLHCAAVVGPQPAMRDPETATSVNVMGMASVLEAARVHRLKVIHLSTATLYGTRPDLRPLSEDDPTDPVGIYDFTKLMAETLCEAYRKTWKCDVASIRTGFVYGAGHSTGEYFVERSLAGEAITEAAGGDHPCDFTYVADLANGMLLAAEHSPLQFGIYNVTGGQLRKRSEFARVVEMKILQARISLGAGLDGKRHLRGACKIDRAKLDFGYAPKFDIENGIEDWVASKNSDR